MLSLEERVEALEKKMAALEQTAQPQNNEQNEIEKLMASFLRLKRMLDQALKSLSEENLKDLQLNISNKTDV